MEHVKHRLTHRERQALATHQLIVDTSRALFVQRGYGKTTIEDIAVAAGVAVSTVYAIFKNKRGILRAIREQWHLASQQRDIYASALQERDGARRLALAAHATRRQWETGADMTAIYRGAASVDKDAATELATALQGRREHIGRFIQETLPLLRPGLGAVEAAAIFRALTLVEVYEELVNHAGWSPDKYEQWLTTALRQQLL